MNFIRKSDICNLKKVKKLIPVIAGFFSATALAMPGTVVVDSGLVDMLVNEINGIGMPWCIAFVVIMVWYWKAWDFLTQHKHWVIHFLSLLFSVFTLIGKSYSQLGNWEFIFYNKRQFVIALLAFIGFFILYEACIYTLFHVMDSRKNYFDYGNIGSSRFLQKVKKHYFLFAFVFISIIWLPWLILFLPGSVPTDGYAQINMAFGIGQITNHHPWMVTLIIGGIMRIGRMVSDNFGVFCVVFTFFIVEALCYSFICYKIRQWKVSRTFNIIILLFFALLPVFGSYAQAVIKDGIFAALFAFFMILYAECCFSSLHVVPEINMKKQICLLFVVGFLVCMIRNNGIYLILPAEILLFFILDKRKKKWALFMALVLVLGYFGVEKKLAPAIGVLPGSMREMLSIPFQQTARYLKEYPDDVTEVEAETIGKVLVVDGLAEQYKPEISDPVKNTFHSQTKQDLIDYFKVWISMFQKHPGVYFEATIHGTYGYVYPFCNSNASLPYQIYIKGEPVATGEFDIHYIMPERIRNWIGNYAYAWQNIPGLAQLSNTGFYTWVLLLFGCYLIYCRYYKRLILFVPALLNVAVCIASPVNGCLRYVLPLIACTPVLFCSCFVCRNEDLNNN